MKHFLAIATIILNATLMAVAADTGDWKIHSSFHIWHQKVIDTPRRVFIHTNSQVVTDWVAAYRTPRPVLFVYDKEAEEMMAWNKRNKLSGNLVSFVDYNADRGYLLVVYDDSNIDFIYDDGEVFNVSGIMTSNIASSKKVNFVTFDSAHKKVYLATDFGYVAIDDERHVISESLIINRPLLSAGRVGDRLVIFGEQDVKWAPAEKKGLAYTDFKDLDGVSWASRLMPVNDNCFVYITSDGSNHMYKVMLEGDRAVSCNRISEAPFNAVSHNKLGYYIDSGNSAFLLDSDGNLTAKPLPPTVSGAQHGSWDFKEIWTAEGANGLRSFRMDGDNWTMTRNFIAPNAPAPFISEHIVYTNKYGLLVANHGTSRQLGDNRDNPGLIGAYRNGEWSNYGLVFSNPARQWVTCDAVGLAPDPLDEKYIYQGSKYHGLSRINLENGQDILHLTGSTDPDMGQPGTFDGLPAAYDISASEPGFDADGTLWFANYDLNDTNLINLYCWTAEDRKTGNVSTIKKITKRNVKGNWSHRFLPLSTSTNRGLLLYCRGEYEAPIIIIDTKNTPANGSDDVVATISKPTDQDGKSVDFHYVYCFFEDPLTGTIWVGTDTGVFTFNARNALTDSGRVNRVKVSRNDGTNLADYLLNNVGVYDIIHDSRGRKWFASGGAGLVCTTTDGHEVVSQLNTENSYLPDNTIYELGFVPETNSIMVSTAQGLAEYFPSGAVTGNNFDSVRVYPNPVRPDYYGWITVDGLADNAIVKVMDSHGNLVKELDRAEGGVVRWDATNLQHKRVASGVYFFFASASEGDQNMAKVAKVLVVN